MSGQEKTTTLPTTRRCQDDMELNRKYLFPSFWRLSLRRNSTKVVSSSSFSSSWTVRWRIVRQASGTTMIEYLPAEDLHCWGRRSFDLLRDLHQVSATCVAIVENLRDTTGCLHSATDRLNASIVSVLPSEESANSAQTTSVDVLPRSADDLRSVRSRRSKCVQERSRRWSLVLLSPRELSHLSPITRRHRSCAEIRGGLESNAISSRSDSRRSTRCQRSHSLFHRLTQRRRRRCKQTIDQREFGWNLQGGIDRLWIHRECHTSIELRSGVWLGVLEWKQSAASLLVSDL